ncbi:hypothetical protein ACLOJK_041801 [Asimina triloba]
MIDFKEFESEPSKSAIIDFLYLRTLRRRRNVSIPCASSVLHRQTLRTRRRKSSSSWQFAIPSSLSKQSRAEKMQQGGDYTASYFYPHHQNPNPSSNPNPNDLIPSSYASAPPFSHYPPTIVTTTTTLPTPHPSDPYSSSYPPFSQNPDPVPNLPPSAPSYSQPTYPPYAPATAAPDYPPHLQQPPPAPYYPYDPQPTAANYPSANPSFSAPYNAPPSSYSAPPPPPTVYENPPFDANSAFKYDRSGGGGYLDENSGSYGYSRSNSYPGGPRNDGLEEGVYAYDGGRVEPYGARGTGGTKSSSSSSGVSGFDDYGRSLSFGKERQAGSGKIVRAVPKVEMQQDVKNGVQKYRVKLLPESSGQSTMDVLCQIGLDGIRMLDPSSNRTLRIYPLENVTRWEVNDPSVYTFWAKSPVDIDPRRIRLQSNSYTTSTILDTVTAATVQVCSCGGSDILRQGSNHDGDCGGSKIRARTQRFGPSMCPLLLLPSALPLFAATIALLSSLPLSSHHVLSTFNPSSPLTMPQLMSSTTQIAIAIVYFSFFSVVFTKASLTLKEMGGSKSRVSPDAGKQLEQLAEKKKGFGDWMNLIKPVNEEKDHWMDLTNVGPGPGFSTSLASLGAPVPDEAVTKCTSCGTDFGAFVRKHHCRNCGDIFCDKCTYGRIALTADENAQPVRVCDRCLAEVSQRLSNSKDASNRTAAQQSHEDLARKLQEEMERNRKASSAGNHQQFVLPSLVADDHFEDLPSSQGEADLLLITACDNYIKPMLFLLTGTKLEASGRQMKEVACPICTVHLQVQVPTSGSETIECGVCQNPFLFTLLLGSSLHGPASYDLFTLVALNKSFWCF